MQTTHLCPFCTVIPLDRKDRPELKDKPVQLSCSRCDVHAIGATEEEALEHFRNHRPLEHRPVTIPAALRAELERTAAIAQLKDDGLTEAETFALAALGGVPLTRTPTGLRTGPCGVFRINGAWQVIQGQPAPEK